MPGRSHLEMTKRNIKLIPNSLDPNLEWKTAKEYICSYKISYNGFTYSKRQKGR